MSTGTIAATPSAVVLASGSASRRALMERLQVDFVVDAPGLDETAQAGEEPAQLVTRLAAAKAAAVADRHPGAVIIGSDQAAVLEGEILGKPGGREAAIDQLTRSSGRVLEFMTGVCVLDTRAADDEPLVHVDFTRVAFRALTPGQIGRYVDRDTPFDCAGSFRAESLGIALFERLDAQDPTGLLGLPLIWLTSALRSVGVEVV